MVRLVEKMSGKKIPYKVVDRRPGDLPMSYCNADKAKKELGWEAKVPLQESIKNMLRFYKIS
jgi:UDP-glucose 4-epimerase